LDYFAFNFNEIRDVCIITPVCSVQEQRDKPIIICRYFDYKWSGIAHSVWRLVAGWTVRGLNRGGFEFFPTISYRSWGPPSLLHNGYQVTTSGKAVGVSCW